MKRHLASVFVAGMLFASGVDRVVSKSSFQVAFFDLAFSFYLIAGSWKPILQRENT